MNEDNVTGEESKKCPFCGETILAIAKKCRYCGEMLDGSSPSGNVNPGSKSSSSFWGWESNCRAIGRLVIIGVVLFGLGVIFLPSCRRAVVTHVVAATRVVAAATKPPIAVGTRPSLSSIWSKNPSVVVLVSNMDGAKAFQGKIWKKTGNAYSGGKSFLLGAGEVRKEFGSLQLEDPFYNGDSGIIQIDGYNNGLYFTIEKDGNGTCWFDFLPESLQD